MSLKHLHRVGDDAPSPHISPEEPPKVPNAMPEETIYVAPLSLVQATIAKVRVSHLVTLINGDTLVPTPPSIGPERHLRLDMNDICEPADGLVLPCAAFISLCALNPEADEFKLARALRAASPTAYPNRRLVTLGDNVLSRSGRMVAAVEHIGRGELAEEGKVFALSATTAGSRG
jgi:predicted protein tyrosine phosphatase